MGFFEARYFCVTISAFRPWYVNGLKPTKGRAIVLAVDYVVDQNNINNVDYLKRRREIIEQVVDHTLMLASTQDQVQILDEIQI